MEIFATCQPGIEPFLHREIFDLGLTEEIPDQHQHAGEGGIAFQGSLNSLYQANLWLRTATRVLVRLGRFHALQFAELRKKAASLPWEEYLHPGQPVAIHTTCHRSKLYHSGAVSERISGAIGDRLKKQPDIFPFTEEGPSPQRVVVRLDHDECTISLDTSGEPLYRRGYRLAVAKAPLRENLAAAMLFASGWDLHSPLIDPFCGSGVIPIEAALLASGTPPGINRRFAFFDFLGFQPAEWNGLVEQTRSEIHPPAGSLLGSDRDAGAIKSSIENAARAGVDQWIEFSHKAVSSILPPASPSGWVVTNPPYGARISSGADLRSLYQQFGKVLREKCPGWKAAYLCNDERLATQTRLEFGKGVSFINGGIPVKLTRGTVPVS